MILLILAGPGTDFQNMVTWTNVLQQQVEKIVGTVIRVVAIEKVADSRRHTLVREGTRAG